MSALPPKADIAEHDRNVRFVPIADVTQPTGRDAIRWGAVVKDRHKDVARFRRCVGTVRRDLTGDAAAIFRDDFSERIALNGDPLSGFDLVI
jgi:hypothetical protein